MKQKVREMPEPSSACRRLRRLDSCATSMTNSKRIVRTALTGAMLLACSTSLAAETQTASAVDQASGYRAVGLGLVGVAVGVSILGAGYAVGRIGSAALGAISEKPELLPRAILFVALGEGLAVLGFAFAMLLLQKM